MNFDKTTENADKPFFLKTALEPNQETSQVNTATVNKEFSSKEKVLLNRKANELFNNKNYETAKKIYLTTMYSAGLSQMGDLYMNQENFTEAFKMYILAKRTDKSEPLANKVIGVLRTLLGESNG